MKGRAVILAAALAAATSTAWAQEAAEEPVVIDPVVAIVDGAPIFASEILLLYQSLGPDVTRVAFATLYPQLLQGSIDRKLAAIRATADGPGRRARGGLQDPVLGGAGSGGGSGQPLGRGGADR